MEKPSCPFTEIELELNPEIKVTHEYSIWLFNCAKVDFKNAVKSNIISEMKKASLELKKCFNRLRARSHADKS